MNRVDFCRLAGRLLSHPAAPYHEAAVTAEAARICAEHGLECQRDDFGNLLVRLQSAPKRRAVVLAAHLDHPGFELERSGKGWLARFRGGVPQSYFRRGVRLLLMPGRIPARLGRPEDREQKLFRLELPEPLECHPEFGVWDLEDFATRHGRIYARACDDLIGVSAILATLIDLRRSRAKVNVLGVLSRAEEVGFQGALALAAASRGHASGRGKRPSGRAGSGRVLPPDALVISLETSRELPGVKMGRGVIIRVGDKASVFDSDATRYLTEVAGGLQPGRRGFQFQRALMSGGTCEATAYQEFGFQSSGVCIALGNYHNCGRRDRIAAEFVNIFDACSMVDLLVAAARQMANYANLIGRLPARLDKLLLEARSRLR